MNFVARNRLDAAAFMAQGIKVLALRLQHEAAITRTLRGDERAENLLGLIVSDDEAESILAEASGRLAVSGTAASAAELAAMQEQLAQARQADPDCIWARLQSAFCLAEAELELLFLAAAPAIDPRIGRVYGYLNDDMGKRHLIPTLALRLLDDHGIDLLTLRRMLATDSPLVQARLVIPGAERPFAECALRVDEALIDMLLGGALPSAAGAGSLTRIPVMSKPAARAKPEVLLIHAQGPADPLPDVFETASALGLDVMVLDHGVFANLDRAAFFAALAGAIRNCRLENSLPVLNGFDGANQVERRDAVSLATQPLIILTGNPRLWQDAGLAAKSVDAKPLGDIERRAWIDRLAANRPAYTKSECKRLARLRQLPLLTLANAAAAGREPEDLALTAADLLRSSLSGLARTSKSGHRLADMVLLPKSESALRGLVASQQTMGTVLEAWDLGAIMGKRRSTTVLFKGPSGTGKSMAAGALANELGLPLFHVDLAGMVSKYIGETEKNLDRLFEAAALAEVILFFDEADAIFGERTEIQDARDRYANLQTSYLLQRLENFDGISILATNLQKNIDEAFLRRIDLVVDFPAPGKADRLALWRRIQKSKAPLAKDIDFDFLAERMELTGAEIRNCWLDAAHQAAHCGKPISMDMILKAIGRELVKQGKPVRKNAFGDAFARLGIGEGSP